MSELKKVKSRYGGLPTDTDLQGAARALNRLQDIYKLNVTQVMFLGFYGILRNTDYRWVGRTGGKVPIKIDRVPYFSYLSKNPFKYTTNMATFVVRRHPVTILVTDFTNPENLTNVLLILNIFTFKHCL